MKLQGTGVIKRIYAKGGEIEVEYMSVGSVCYDVRITGAASVQGQFVTDFTDVLRPGDRVNFAGTYTRRDGAQCEAIQVAERDNGVQAVETTGTVVRISHDRGGLATINVGRARVDLAFVHDALLYPGGTPFFVTPIELMPRGSTIRAKVFMKQDGSIDYIGSVRASHDTEPFGGMETTRHASAPEITSAVGSVDSVIPQHGSNGTTDSGFLEDTPGAARSSAVATVSVGVATRSQALLQDAVKATRMLLEACPNGREMMIVYRKCPNVVRMAF